MKEKKTEEEKTKGWQLRTLKADKDGQSEHGHGEGDEERHPPRPRERYVVKVDVL